MTESEILQRLADVVRRTFPGAASLTITMETTADQVQGWDSLAHALFLMRVERALAVRFEPMDVVDLANIGGLVCLIARLMSA
ncbi:MAG: acyl carrier protein [Rhodopila sp.]|nr:acyl carrier protein [Rhodopila sp.]